MSVVPESIEYNIPFLNTTLLMSLVVWLVLFVLSLLASRKAKIVPGGLQSAFEICLEMVYRMADDAIGEEAYRYYPLFLGVFFYILVANMLGLIPGMISPTANINTTAALSVVVFLYYNLQGFKKEGLKYLGHFFGPKLPVWLMPVNLLIFVIEIIGNFARPFSLAIRLFCNIFSKEILLGLLALLLIKFIAGPGIIERSMTIAPLLLRPGIILLGLMLGVIQAFIFLILSITYVAGAVRLQEEH